MLFSFILIIDLCFLITAVIVQSFNSTVGLATPVGIQINEVKAGNEAQSVTGEFKTSKSSK